MLYFILGLLTGVIVGMFLMCAVIVVSTTEAVKAQVRENLFRLTK